jgi:hypothetical protein
MNASEKLDFHLSPLFCAIGSLCATMTVLALWEVYEFAIDCIFQTNVQKFMLPGGEILIGQAALSNTMMDLIIGFCGALAAIAYGFALRLLSKTKTTD